jgi:Ca-activated chloride channel family protein
MKLYPRMNALVITTLFGAIFCVEGQTPDATPPISIGIVLDTSGSMTYKLARARQLVSELLKLASPLDEFALIQAADRPVVVGGYGSTVDALQPQVAFMQAKGRSALLDGVYTGLQVSKAGRNARKVLVVISDGGENGSRYTEAEMRNAVAEADVRVYVVGVDEGADRPAWLLQIVERSGGRYFGMESAANSPQVASDVMGAMRAPR